MIDMSASDRTPLKGKDRRALRARAHSLHPILTIGAAGLTDGVLAEGDRALDDHELIKVKVAHEDREGRRELIDGLCEGLDAELIQTIGKIAVIWREHQDTD